MCRLRVILSNSREYIHWTANVSENLIRPSYGLWKTSNAVLNDQSQDIHTYERHVLIVDSARCFRLLFIDVSHESFVGWTLATTISLRDIYWEEMILWSVYYVGFTSQYSSSVFRVHYCKQDHFCQSEPISVITFLRKAELFFLV